jgi:hypothetical protein
MKELERATSLYEVSTPLEMRLSWMLNNEAENDARRHENPPQPLTKKELRDLDERCAAWFGDD